MELMAAGNTYTQVKGRYKKTEIGQIPEDWDVVELGSLGSFSKGKGIKRDEVKSYGNPCVRYGELYTKYNNYIDEITSFINDDVAQQSCLVRTGDILFAGSGETKEEIGKCAALVTSEPVYAGGDIVVFRPRFVDSMFLGYLLNSPAIARQKSINGQGDAVVHIYSSGLSKVKIPLPPTVQEQSSIATALYNVDKAIGNLEKLIAKKKAIIQGAMQQLLKSPTQGGKRLVGFHGEWKEEKLMNLLLSPPKYGINAPAVDFSESLPQYLRITDISDSGEFIKEGKASVKHSDWEKYVLQEGDIVLARTGASVGKSYLYNSNDGTLVYAGFLIKVSSDPKKLVSRYLKAFLQTKTYWDWVKIMSVRSGQPGINGNEYASLTIPLPPTLAEQEAISTILSDMDAEIENLQKKKAKYQCIKQGMMQELLTGKTRLV